MAFEPSESVPFPQATLQFQRGQDTSCGTVKTPGQIKAAQSGERTKQDKAHPSYYSSRNLHNPASFSGVSIKSMVVDA